MTARSPRRREISLRSREALHGYGFILIWVVGFALFTLLPLGETIRYSFNQVTVTATSINLNFVEWANYTRALFTDPTFVELLIGYTIETLVSVPIVLIFAMIIAMFLNVNFRLKGVFRVIFFLPIVITSGPVIKELTAQGAASAPGFANIQAVRDFLEQLSPALRSPVEYLLTSFILILWFSGVQILIYLASLQKIDKSIYEAAGIDGASGWEMFWKITLPNLSTATVINAIYTIVTLSHFSENKVIQYIYKQTYDVHGGIGYASAMAFIYFGVMIALLAIIYFFLRQWAKEIEVTQILHNPYTDRLRSFLLGSRARHGLVFSAVLYALLIAIGFVYLHPLLFMFVTSIKNPGDLLNPMVQWVPTEFYLGNYIKAFRVLDYPNTLLASILISVIPSLLQTFVASLVGYGLARYRFRGKQLVLLLLLATFIIPPQNTVIPQMLTYRNLGLLGNPLALILPALLGQGFRSAIFILIFYQSFLSLPKVLEESARLDGASDLRIFFTVAMPSALPAYIVSFIFSIVWYWNETFLTVIFLADGTTTLPMQLSRFTQAYENLYPPGTVNIFDRLNEAVKMSGTFLNILPLLVMYFVLQRWFVRSVEMTGITGE